MSSTPSTIDSDQETSLLRIQALDLSSQLELRRSLVAELERVAFQLHLLDNSNESTPNESQHSLSPPPTPKMTANNNDDIRKLPYFSGDSDTATHPHQWLRDFQTSIGYPFDEKAALYHFPLRLEVNSRADGWWANLDPQQKDTWAHLKTAFAIEWPVPRASAGASTLVKSERLRNDILTEGEALSIAENGQYGFVIWAKRVRRLAREIPDPTNLLLPPVIDHIPSALRHLLPNSTTWDDFEAAIECLTRSAVVNAFEREKEREAMRQYMQMPPLQLPMYYGAPPATPTRTMPIQQQTPAQYNTVPAHLAPAPPRFTTPPMPSTPRGPPATPQHRQLPPTPGSTTFWQGGTTPHQRPFGSFQMFGPPPTPQTPTPNPTNRIQFPVPSTDTSDTGMARYRNEVESWRRAFVGQQPTLNNPFPLRPGTSPLASRECWTCGIRDMGQQHTNGQCSQPALEPEEQYLRRIAVGAARANAASRQLFYVGSPAYPAYDDGSAYQGNE